MKFLAIGLAIGLAAAGAAHAADVPDMVGTWKPPPIRRRADRRCACRLGGVVAPGLQSNAAPVCCDRETRWTRVSGYEVLPDGSRDPFVGVFKRDGKQLLVSTNVGVALADVSGNEMEWCWLDHLSLVAVAACDVMKKGR